MYSIWTYVLFDAWYLSFDILISLFNHQQKSICKHYKMPFFKVSKNIKYFLHKNNEKNYFEVLSEHCLKGIMFTFADV